jgi:hypothetical protein
MLCLSKGLVWFEALFIFAPCFVYFSETSKLNGMESIQMSVNRRGFVYATSGKPFVPWGHNYASVDVLKRLEENPARIAREFAEMKQSGTTVVRLHPELPRLLKGPMESDPKGLEGIRKLIEIAEGVGIYLKLTGLANYTIRERPAWYDNLSERERWRTQAFYWEAVAGVCANSSAVFAYDLVNEPASVGKPEDGWYTGRMGDVEFCQRLSLGAGKRTGDDVFREWTEMMISSIRKHDASHMITMGMLPFPNAYKSVSEQLDFVSPHLYPKSGKVSEELELLKKFEWGKPIVIGETFPLSCSADELRDFLLQSRCCAAGWIGHWPDEAPEELKALRKSGKATVQNAIWLSWVELFEALGPMMRQ